MVAMLDLAIRNIPSVENNHSGVFVMPTTPGLCFKLIWAIDI